MTFILVEEPRFTKIPLLQVMTDFQFFFLFNLRNKEKKNYKGIFPTIDSNWRDKRGWTRNASKNFIGSGLLSNLMYSVISTPRDFDGSPSLEKVELLMDIFYDRGKSR